MAAAVVVVCLTAASNNLLFLPPSLFTSKNQSTTAPRMLPQLPQSPFLHLFDLPPWTCLALPSHSFLPFISLSLSLRPRSELISIGERGSCDTNSKVDITGQLVLHTPAVAINGIKCQFIISLDTFSNLCFNAFLLVQNETNLDSWLKPSEEEVGVPHFHRFLRIFSFSHFCSTFMRILLEAEKSMIVKLQLTVSSPGAVPQ